MVSVFISRARRTHDIFTCRMPSRPLAFCDPSGRLCSASHSLSRFPPKSSSLSDRLHRVTADKLPFLYPLQLGHCRGLEPFRRGLGRPFRQQRTGCRLNGRTPAIPVFRALDFRIHLNSRLSRLRRDRFIIDGLKDCRQSCGKLTSKFFPG